MCANSWRLSKAEVLLSAGRYLPFSGVFLLSLISWHITEASANVVQMKSAGDLASASFPNLITTAQSVYLWYYSYCNISYYSTVKFCHLALYPTKDLDTAFVGIHSWEGLQSHPADPANKQLWNSVQWLQPYDDLHVLQPATLYGCLNWARESHFCRWVTKLHPCESLRGHRSGVSTATYMDSYSPASSCR